VHELLVQLVHQHNDDRQLLQNLKIGVALTLVLKMVKINRLILKGRTWTALAKRSNVYRPRMNLCIIP
jgi:hypothetical protein